MRDVAITGIGQTKAGEHWDKSLRHLALEAIQAALADAGVIQANALYVGNMLSGELAGQEHLGALVADFAGLRGIEAIKIEAACGSGAAALRVGYIAVAGGLADIVVVVGVEKMTDMLGHDITAALALAADGEYEAFLGLSFVAVNALLMRRYMHEFGYSHADFAPFAVNAHRNGKNNPHAMFRFPLKAERFATAPMVCDPINLMDSSPTCDGAAAVVLAPGDSARAFSKSPVRVAASAAGTDTLAVHDRRFHEFDGEVGGIGTDHRAVDRIDAPVHNDLAPARCADCHLARLVQRGPAVIERRVGGFHSQEPADQRLVFVDRLESALAYFGLIGRV